MDIFKQKRYQFVVIILLIILNLGTLLMLTLGRPQRPPEFAGPPHPGREQAQIKRLLRTELEFNEDQIKQFLILRKEHHKQMQKLSDEIRQLKKQMFDEVLEDDAQATLSDSLLNLTQVKQAQIDRLTYNHFLDIKKISKPEQQKKLRLLIHGMFRRQQPGPGDAPPPPPGEGGMPPPPNDF